MVFEQVTLPDRGGRAPIVLPPSRAQSLDDRPRRAASPLPRWRLRRVIGFVEENLDQRITLSDLAAQAGLSRMHFAAQFGAATGMQPHAYVQRRRIEQAKELLAETEERLVDVALSVGFQTQAHFTTVFKQETGETPRRWRMANCRLA